MFFGGGRWAVALLRYCWGIGSGGDGREEVGVAGMFAEEDVAVWPSGVPSLQSILVSCHCRWPGCWSSRRRVVGASRHGGPCATELALACLRGWRVPVRGGLLFLMHGF